MAAAHSVGTHGTHDLRADQVHLRSLARTRGAGGGNDHNVVGLQQVALPELSAVANEFGMTCLVAVLVDAEEAVTLVSAAPRQTTAVVSYRPGHRHPITRGGPGKAILLGLPESAWPADVSDDLRAEMAESRARGYTLSQDEVVPSLRSVAVPLTLPGQPPAAIAVIHVSFPRPEAEIAERLKAAARNVARNYGA